MLCTDCKATVTCDFSATYLLLFRVHVIVSMPPQPFVSASSCIHSFTFHKMHGHGMDTFRIGRGRVRELDRI